MKNFKNSFWFPHFLDRRTFEIREEGGSRDLSAVLNEKAKEIFRNHQPQRLPEKVVRSINDIIASHQSDIE